MHQTTYRDVEASVGKCQDIFPALVPTALAVEHRILSRRNARVAKSSVFISGVKAESVTDSCRQRRFKNQSAPVFAVHRCATCSMSRPLALSLHMSKRDTPPAPASIRPCSRRNGVTHSQLVENIGTSKQQRIALTSNVCSRRLLTGATALRKEMREIRVSWNSEL